MEVIGRITDDVPSFREFMRSERAVIFGDAALQCLLKRYTGREQWASGEIDFLVSLSHRTEPVEIVAEADHRGKVVKRAQPVQRLPIWRDRLSKEGFGEARGKYEGSGTSGKLVFRFERRDGKVVNVVFCRGLIDDECVDGSMLTCLRCYIGWDMGACVAPEITLGQKIFAETSNWVEENRQPSESSAMGRMAMRLFGTVGTREKMNRKVEVYVKRGFTKMVAEEGLFSQLVKMKVWEDSNDGDGSKLCCGKVIRRFM